MKENLKRQVYEAPKAEVIEIVSQGVLCASAPTASTGAGGGTTKMNVQDGYGW
jgi:hypothetical protein